MRRATGRIMAYDQSTADSVRVTTPRHVKWRKVAVNWQLYLLCLLPIAWLIIFMYIPMYGNLIAFKRYVPSLGILGSPWVGFDNFLRFFQSYRFFQVLGNTFYLSFYDLVVGFPIPIGLAIVLHYMPIARYKKTVQMVTYAPHFISTVVMVGIIFKLGSQRIGVVNVLLTAVGLPEVNFLGSAQLFGHVFVWTNVWQQMGWGTIIYLAALSSVDPELHESATVDGASIWRRIRHIDFPGILPTVIILLILRTGFILQVGFEKVFLLQNNLNIEASEVIQTYVYKIGIASRNPNFHYATAIGLFQNLVMFLMLIVVNRIARRVSETSLW